MICDCGDHKDSHRLGYGPCTECENCESFQAAPYQPADCDTAYKYERDTEEAAA